MKWDKAITYLIVVFLCVNIALGLANYNRSVRTYRLSDRRQDNITAVLKNSNIILKTKLPISFMPTSPIWVLPMEFTPTMRDSIVKAILGDSTGGITITKEASEEPYEKPVRVYTKGDEQLRFRTNYVQYENKRIVDDGGYLTESKAKDIATEFLNHIDVPKSSQKIKIEYRNESYGGSLTYYEVYEKLPIFGSYVHLKMTSEGVFEAVIHGNTVEDKVGAKQVIYAIDEVLFGLTDELDTEGPIVIDHITLGYAIPHTVETHVLREEAIPMYKISIQGLDEPIFVNAYTNIVENLPTGTFYK